MYMQMYTASMSKRYSIAEARSNLPTIVDQAEAGQEIELTRRGKPVAVVVSLRELEKLRRKPTRFRETYKRFLKTHPLKEIGLDPDFFESGRERDSGRKVAL
jgi:prevent-host-death family protein